MQSNKCLILAIFLICSSSYSAPQMSDSCLEQVATGVTRDLEKQQPKSDVHLVKDDSGKVIGLTDSEDVYGNFDLVGISLPQEDNYYQQAYVQFSDSQVTAIAKVSLMDYKKNPICKIENISSIVSKSKSFTCHETKQSSKENGYGRILTIQVSNDKKKIIITSPRTEDFLAFAEIVEQDDHDSSSDEDGNLDEDYNRKTESRYFGSDEITSTDTGAIVFVEKSILSGKSGKIRLSGGQGNESDTGPAVLWFENAVLDCK